MSERRYRRVVIDFDFLTQILTTGWSIGDAQTITCIDGLPEGAKFIHAIYDVLSDTENLVFEHESFEPIPQGQMIPVSYISWKMETRDLTRFTLINDAVSE